MAVMGYLVFDTLGWRVFIVITTMPVLVLSIFILHFYLPSKGEEGSEDEVDTKSEKIVSDVFGRTLKASIFQMAFFLPKLVDDPPSASPNQAVQHEEWC